PLTGPQDQSEEYRRVYQRRRDLAVGALRRAGFHVTSPGGGLYIWGRVPAGFGSSMEFTKHLLEQTAVVVTPGNGFGAHGEGYFRIAFTLPDERLMEAMRRIEAFASDPDVAPVLGGADARGA